MAYRIRRDEGASAVEFAIIIPLFLMLVMGMITTGICFFRQLSLAGGAREATRFAATLPTGTGGLQASWLDSVADRAIRSSDGQMETTVTGQATCVAYIGYGSPEGSTSDWTQKREQTGTGSATYTAGTVSNVSSWCFDDGRGSSERRVQVVLRRTSPMNAIFFGSNLNLSARSVARFEAVSPS